MRIEQVLEALIFISEAPVKPAQVMELLELESFADFAELELDEKKVRGVLDGMMPKYESEEFPFELKKVDGGYQYFTKTDFYPYLRHAVMMRNQKKLSRAALETLSIIAYRQPTTRPEVEFIRGVNCDYAIQKLLDKNLVEIAGRSDSPGRPLLYKTSSFFMEYFGLNDISDLPKLEEFDMNEEKFQEQFKVFLDDKDDLKEIVEEAKKSGEEENNESEEEQSEK